MDRNENGVYGTNGLSTETHKSFLIHYGCEGNYLKRILYCTKRNEINVCHSYVQIMLPIINGINCATFLRTGLCKSFPIHYAL